MKTKIFLFLLFLSFSSNLFSQPGSSSDPVVTKSYVDNLFGWRKINISKNQVIIISKFTEFVILSGKFTDFAGQNLMNLSEGKFLRNFRRIPYNHHLLVVDEGGVRFKSEADAIILIKGKFEIQ